MKLFLLPCLLLVLLHAACNKKDSGPGYITTDTWQHDSVIFHAGSSNRFVDIDTISIVFFPNGFWTSTPNIHFRFYKNLPKKEGNYKLTYSPTKADELGIQSFEEMTAFYFNPQDAATCYVTVGAGGKLSFRANNVALRQSGPNGSQILNYSFNLTEF